MDLRTLPYAHVDRSTTFTDFTPDVARDLLSTHKDPGTIVLGAYVWDDVISNADWQQFYAPPVVLDKTPGGDVGCLMGMKIVADAWLYEELRTIPRNTVYIVSKDESYMTSAVRG